MALNTGIKEKFIADTRGQVGVLLQAMQTLNGLRQEYDALNLGSILVDADFVGDNAGITAAQLVAAYSSVAAIQSLLASGHNTNLNTVRR
jgi:hypothetical protein